MKDGSAVARLCGCMASGEKSTEKQQSREYAVPGTRSPRLACYYLIFSVLR
jgi:hypothetical protein